MYTRGMAKDNTYVYLDLLLAFDICRPVEDLPWLVISPEIHLSLHTSVWAAELSIIQTKAYVEYILQGISNGFKIGFDRKQHISSAKGNLLIDEPEAVIEYLQREVLLDRMWKIPLSILPRGVHMSPLGIIPKKSKPGKWRLIVDLSSPCGTSINDGIDTDRSS